MKTAQQWHDELLERMNQPAAFRYCHASVEDIRKIQVDALRHAAEIARQLNESVNANEGWHIMNSLTEEADRIEPISTHDDSQAK